jgi:ubiquinone/menaquinone biosynthesis C-methylase UbiE
MSVNQTLLKRFIRDYPFQPATGFWRSIEIGQVISYPFPEGFGLDLGCGDGKLTQIILEGVGHRELVGVDIDPKETAQAEQLRIYQHIHTTPADKIPEADETFDFAFSNSVLEHIDNIEDVLAETARLLKRGGIFLFTVPGDKLHQCLRGPLLPWVSRQTYLKELDDRCAHKRYWSIEDWRKNLAINNLEIEQVNEYLSQSEVQRWETIARFTSGILYVLFGKKKHPIEIQRTLGLRKAETRLPSFLASLLASIFQINLKHSKSSTQRLNGCLMIQARKR